MVITRQCTLAFVGSMLAVFVGACGSEEAPGSRPEARLVVLPKSTDEAMFGTVSGKLKLNDNGCFALDGRVLVVGEGSSVSDDGDSIEIADIGAVTVGSQTSGAGGYIDGTDEVQHFVEFMELDDAALDCQVDKDSPGLAVLDPASS